MAKPLFDYGTARDLEIIIDFCHDLRTHPKLKGIDFNGLNGLCEFVYENEDEEPDHTVYEEPGMFHDVWDTLRDLGFTQRDFI